MYKNFKLLNYIIYVFLLFYLLIDTLTGMSLMTAGISFSIPYKLFVIVLMIIVIGLYNQTDFLIILSLLAWLVLSMTVMLLTESKTFSIAVQTCIKLISVIVFYLYFKSYLQFEKHSYKYLKNIILVNAFVFFANIFAGILGFGYSTYGYGVGIKGFFFAGNEIFLILLAITFLLIKNKSKRFRIVVGCIALLFSILIGTKTAMLALLILLLVNAYKNLNKVWKILVIILIPVLILGFIYLFNTVLANLPIFSTIIYNFERNKKVTGSIVGALLSGRIDFLNNNLNYFNQQTDLLHSLFGGNSYYNDKNVEIDFFDALILNGGVMAVIILCFYIFLLYKSVKKKDITLIAMNFAVFLISFTAGHIWANLTGGIFYIIANLVPEIFAKLKIKRIQLYVI